MKVAKSRRSAAITPEVIEPLTYDGLLTGIGELLERARNDIARHVNVTLVRTYWATGRYIVEYEQNGSDRAKYGDCLIKRLARDLTHRHGKGYSRTNLVYMRKLYLTFRKSQTLSDLLSWSHYLEILQCADELEIQFYCAECVRSNWNVRELRRQMKSALFQRLALSKDKKGVLALAHKGNEIQVAQDILRDHYVLEFTGLKQGRGYTELRLQDALVGHLRNFLLELGKGFAFVGSQYRVPVNVGNPCFVDLVFYNYFLRCFVLIDLKRGKVEHYDIGQMNLYLNYFKAEEGSPTDNEPIGIVLGAGKDDVMVEYATQGITNKIFVSRYQLYLPDKEQLRSELARALEEESRRTIPKKRGKLVHKATRKSAAKWEGK